VGIALLDLDGVCCDWHAPALAFHGKRMSDVAWHPGLWDVATYLGMTQAQFFAPIAKAGAAWWEKLEPYPHFNELYRLLHARVGQVVFLSLTSNDAETAAGKARWIAKHAPGSQYFLGTASKGLLAASDRLLVDDSPDNCKAFLNGGGFAMLWPQPWNGARLLKIEDALGMITQACDMIVGRRGQARG
jgi:hypothetical protein